jgi:hypothetical protein
MDQEDEDDELNQELDKYGDIDSSSKSKGQEIDVASSPQAPQTPQEVPQSPQEPAEAEGDEIDESDGSEEFGDDYDYDFEF